MRIRKKACLDISKALTIFRGRHNPGSEKLETKNEEESNTEATSPTAASPHIEEERAVYGYFKTEEDEIKKDTSKTGKRK